MPAQRAMVPRDGRELDVGVAQELRGAQREAGTLAVPHQKVYSNHTLAESTDPQKLLQYYVRAANSLVLRLTEHRKCFVYNALQYYNHYISLY